MKKIFFILLFFCLAVSVLADPPTPHSIGGYIFHNNSVQVEVGTPYFINNTNSTAFVQNETRLPIPTFTGRYFESINASDNDTIQVRAWNATHYGERIFEIVGNVEGMNITLNLSRPSEPHVVLLIPLNNTAFDAGTQYNITANITIFGGQGIDCNITLSLTDETVTNISVGESFMHQYASLNPLTSFFEVWNLTAGAQGSANATVTMVCASDGFYLESVTNNDTLSNMSVSDLSDPIVSLISPANDSVWSGGPGIPFTYNVSDSSPIANCSLWVNNAFVSTDTTITRDVSQAIIYGPGNGIHNWTVMCVDVSGNSFTPAYFTIDVQASDQNMTLINSSLDQNISLIAGNTKTVFCNLSLNHTGGVDSISYVNATLFHSSSDAVSADTNSSHYTNESCALISNTTYEANYSCGFFVQYYALNGTWSCNLTAQDASVLKNSSLRTTSVDALFAYNLSTTQLDYGEVSEGEMSSEEVMLISNIGNQPLNFTAYGFGAVASDGLAIDCSTGNVSVDYHRFGFASQSYATKTSLSSFTTDIGLTMTRTTDTFFSQNMTYWQLYVTPSADLTLGLCNGTVVLEAVAS